MVGDRGVALTSCDAIEHLEFAVRNHISNIFAKLRITDRAEAIVRARDAGLGRTDHLRTS